MVHRFTGILALALVAVSASARAQGTQDEAARRSMTLLVSAFGAYDADLKRPLPSQEKAKPTIDPGLQLTLDYRRPGPRFTFGWNNNGNVQRYTAADDRLVVAAGDVRATFSGKLTPRSTVQIAQTIGYAPQYMFGALSVLVAAPAEVEQPIVLQSTVTTDRLLSFDTAAGLQYDLGRRSALVFEYAHRRMAFVNLPSAGSTSDRVLGRFTHSLSRNASARVGYGRQIAGDGAGRLPRTTHDFDSGVAYQQDISLTRRTRLAFGGGTSLVASGQVDALATRSTAPTHEVNVLLPGFVAPAHQVGASATGPGAPTHQMDALLTGSASLIHKFGRTWTAGLDYNRGVGFSERLPDPTLTDAVAASASGLLGRRFSVSASVSHAAGRVLGPVGNPFRQTNGSARAQYTPGRRLAIFAGYTMHKHRFATTEQLPSWLLGQNHQWSARAGITWRVPVLR